MRVSARGSVARLVVWGLTAAVWLAWDHPGASRWVLVVDGVEQDITTRVERRGASVGGPGLEPCAGCVEWRWQAPEDFDRRRRITVRACYGEVCSDESNPLGPRGPDAAVVR